MNEPDRVKALWLREVDQLRKKSPLPQLHVAVSAKNKTRISNRNR